MQYTDTIQIFFMATGVLPPISTDDHLEPVFFSDICFNVSLLKYNLAVDLRTQRQKE